MTDWVLELIHLLTSLDVNDLEEGEREGQADDRVPKSGSTPDVASLNINDVEAEESEDDEPDELDLASLNINDVEAEESEDDELEGKTSTVDRRFSIESLLPSTSDSASVLRWIRYHLIECAAPILLLGESRYRSLSIALAVMRGSLDRIWATSFHLPFINTLDQCIDESEQAAETDAEYREWHSDADDTHDPKLIQQEIAILRNWIRKKGNSQQTVSNLFIDPVDAGALHKRPSLPTSIMWFQCPWGDTRSDSRATAELITRFLRSASPLQKIYDMVLVGIIGHSRYNWAYRMEENIQVARQLGYDHFTERQFIQDCLRRGYRHQGLRDIHSASREFHLTHVFVKVTWPKYCIPKNYF